jgi:AcrR family transcriptional regulator
LKQLMATDETTTAILDAAEQLFATKGYDATSIREITRHAGVNVAAVHYHFGAKPAVLRAVTNRVIEPLNARRFRLLDLAQAAAAPDPPPIDAVMDAFIRPDIEILLELHQRGPTVAHFLGRVYSDPTPWVRQMTTGQFAEAERRFFPAIAAAVPHLPPAELAWRMRRLAAVLVHTFATWPSDGMDAAAADLTVRRLVNFAVPVLRAPVIASGTEVPVDAD